MRLLITVVSRHSCHLCRVAYRVAEQLQQVVSFELAAVDVDDDTRLRAQYANRVPVIFINGRETFLGR